MAHHPFRKQYQKSIEDSIDYKYKHRLDKAETGAQHADILHEYGKELSKYGLGHDMSFHGQGKEYGNK